MLGLEDPQIVLAYVMLIGSAVACMVYGWKNRNEAD